MLSEHVEVAKRDRLQAIHTGCGRDPLVRAHFALDRLDVEVGNVRSVSGREVVEYTDFVALAQQGTKKVGADEAGPAGYKCSDSHRCLTPYLSSAIRSASAAWIVTSIVSSAPGSPRGSPSSSRRKAPNCSRWPLSIVRLRTVFVRLLP
jgi:hypothetical protein